MSITLCFASLCGCGTKKLESVTETEAVAETKQETVTEAPTETPVPTETPAPIKVTEQAEESEIFVEPVANISDDFIRGMDASAVLSLENSGVTYYNYEGEEQDVFQTLAESGVNYIRLRVWNDPYDENGNGYGGGNNDLATAVTLGARASKYGMKVCIDFHYSDFWADPKRQHAPKAWEGMTVEEKCDALSAYTKESLTTHNSELLGAYGNLVNRTLAFIAKYRDGILPEGKTEEEIAGKIDVLYKNVGKKIEEGEIRSALEEIFEFVRFGNQYFDKKQPWKTRTEDEKACEDTLYQCVQIIGNAAVLLAPFLPFSSEKVLQWLAITKEWEPKTVEGGRKLPEISILFNRLDKGVIEEEKERLRSQSKGNGITTSV